MKTKDADYYTSIANALEKPYETVRAVYFSDMNDQSDLGKFSQAQFEENVIRMLDLEPEKIETLRRVHEEQTFLDDVMMEKVQALRDNYKIGLLSNYTDGLRKRIEHEWKIGDLFDAIIISSEVGVIKPDSAIFKIILDELGARPHEAVLIDDRIKNIHGAQDVGMHAIFYQDREQTLSSLDSLLQTV